MKLNKKSRIAGEIPTASLPDIVFMLLIFFMVATVLRKFSGLPVILPSATQITKLESRTHVTEIWVSKEGMISIDGKLVNVGSIRNIIYEKRVEDPQIIISLKADRQCTMQDISAIHKELREADALKVNYSTKFSG